MDLLLVLVNLATLITGLSFLILFMIIGMLVYIRGSKNSTSCSCKCKNKKPEAEKSEKK